MHGSPIAGEREPAERVIDPSDRELRSCARVEEFLGDPATFDGHARLGAAEPVERGLQLGLEEHVVRLPARPSETLNVEAQQQLAVGPEPLVVVDRDHLLSERLGEPE